jgi:hypothetical protein
MILQALLQLYDRLVDDDDYGIAPPGHSIQKITFRVVLYPDGRLFEIQPVSLKTAESAPGRWRSSATANRRVRA